MQLRKVRKKFRRFRFILWSLAAILVLIGIAYLILHSGFLSVSNIEVQSIGVYTDSKVIDKISNYALGKSRARAVLGPDNILFWLFLSEKDILSSNFLPIAADINIHTNPIDKVVKIAIKEKKMKGIYCNRQCYVFDQDGRIFLRAPEVYGSLILKIDDETGRHITLGREFLPNDKWLDNLFVVLDAVQSRDLSVRRARIKDLSKREWEVELFKGPILYFSFEHKPMELEKVLGTVVEKVDITQLNYLDFRVEGRIYYE